MKIISGGQTGVDRGALRAARAMGFPHGGWCPKGRLAEDGPIDASFHLTETDSAEYAIRTEKNVLDSDGTLILHRGRLSGGTLLTLRLAQQHSRPHMVVDLNAPCPMHEILWWIEEEQIETLNVAGPRESQNPGIEAGAEEFVRGLFEAIE